MCVNNVFTVVPYFSSTYTVCSTLWASQLQNFALTETIKHDHKINDTDNKSTLAETWDKY
jgi:hypothetical protein